MSIGTYKCSLGEHINVHYVLRNYYAEIFGESESMCYLCGVNITRQSSPDKARREEMKL